MPGGIPLLYSSGTYDDDVYGGDPLDEETLMLIREKPPLRTSTEIVTPSGRRYRWAADEPDPDNVPGGQRWSDTMPGGFESYNATLPRKPGTDYRDLERLSTVTVTGAGGRAAWQGRLESAPSTSGDQMAVTPAAVGWQAALEDNKSAVEIYIDRDLSHWREASATRRLAQATVPVAQGTTQTVADPSTGIPGLVLAFQGPWTEAAGMRAEAYYQAPAGETVANVFLDWSTNTAIGTGPADWTLQLWSTEDETSFPEGSSDQLTGAASSGPFGFIPTTARREMMLQLAYTVGPAGTDGTNYELIAKNVCVFSNHVTLQGDSASTYGFLASDVVAHAVAAWAPALNITTDSIQPSTYIIPHLVFLEPTTAAEIVKQASRFELPDWAVWEGPIFYWNPRNARGRRWRARIGPSELEETGPQTDRLWNSIVVQYQDVDGTTRTVGPPGSGADTETARLQDTDPDNPANRAGITRRDMLNIGISTPERATDIGELFLAEARLLERSGKARAVGHIEDDKGVLHPYWAPRAGDQICFTDAADCSYRRIVKTDKDEATRTVTFDLDAPPEGLQAVLERFGAALVKLGL